MKNKEELIIISTDSSFSISEDEAVSSSNDSNTSSSEDDRTIEEIQKKNEEMNKELEQATKELGDVIRSSLKTDKGLKFFTDLAKMREYQLGDYVIRALKELSEEEIMILRKLLLSFPHPEKLDWPQKLIDLNINSIPKKLQELAANARVRNDRCMLGFALEEGETNLYKKLQKLVANARVRNDRCMLGFALEEGDPNLVLKLLDMGAHLNMRENIDKTMFDWAIENKLAKADKNSNEASLVVKLLLEHWKDIDIKDYHKYLHYAEKKGYMAAASAIKEKIIKNHAYIRGAAIGFFDGRLNAGISAKIADDVENVKDGISLSLTSKSAYVNAQSEAALAEEQYRNHQKI